MEDPPKEIHRFLISTTSRFTGSYESPSIRIDHAWTFGGSAHRLQQGLREGPYSRNYLVLSVAIEEPQRETILMPNYDHVGDRFCAILSVLFGKRFDNHGPLFSQGFFRVPELSNVGPINYFNAAPYGHRSRRDFSPPLSLDSFGLVASLFTEEHSDESFIQILFAAARFYLRSLQVFDQRPEFAYLDLVTCGEVLSNFFDYPHEELFDEATKSMFEKIGTRVEGGDQIVRHLEVKMRQIKRRYTLTLLRLLMPQFFAESECEVELGRLQQADIERRLKASYDLRSQYVHTGIEFGGWMLPYGGCINEVQLGQPSVADKDLAKVIRIAPTYFGLERIIRYCLLRFVHLHGVSISPVLDSPKP